jgi:acyl-coenzyme A thioesterase PaaI-like protein
MPDRGGDEDLYGSLTDSVRRLIDVTIRSEADHAAVMSAQRKIDAAVSELSTSLREGAFGVQHTDDGRPKVWGNAVIGLRNALAPPLVVHHADDGSVWAEATLGAAYEGPAGHVHGGVCALLLDHVLGAAAHEPGRPAVTGTLTARYEAGTPLGPIRIEARIDRVEGPKTFVFGHLETAGRVSVRAKGVFFHPWSEVS